MALPPKKTFATLNSRLAFSLWWRERWVRILVLSIAPLGLIDSLYTLFLWQRYGAQFEVNPIVRLALESDWRYVWMVVNTMSFVAFSIIVGSYYLHTRSQFYSNKIQWFIALIAVRLGLTVYNVLVYYRYWSPHLVSMMIAVLTFLLLSRLLTRTEDLSRDDITSAIRLRVMRLEDYLLKMRVGTMSADRRGISDSGAAYPVRERSATRTESSTMRTRLECIAYLSAALVVFLIMPFALIVIGELTGATAEKETFWPLVWTAQSGTAFVISFFTVAIFVGVIVFLLSKALAVREEGGW